MKHLSLSILSAALVLAVPRAQEADKPAEVKLPDAIKQFAECVNDRKMARDADAIKMIDNHLLKAGREGTDKERASVVAALGKVFDAKARPQDQQNLYKATVASLGEMGKDGGKVLVKVFDADLFKKKDWVAMRAEIAKNVGKTKDEAHVKFLIERARRDTEDTIMAAAGEALGNFESATQAQRKNIVGELLIKYGEVHSGAHKNLDPGDPVVKRDKDTLAAISEPWNATLGRLTGQSFREASEWLNWWNKHKNEDWEKGKPKK